MKIDRFEDIRAWQLAEDLTVKIYELEFKTDYGIDLELIYYKDFCRFHPNLF
ncbi:MAG: hypothetical protein N2258_04175 [Brevinematales bacterium]|nr:hypothetical protein [Brevinematales bacterium]